MTSVDDKIQNIQDKITNYALKNVEPLLTEYILIPLFFEWTFNSSHQSIIKALSIFAVLVRQIINFKIKINQPYIHLMFAASLLAYATMKLQVASGSSFISIMMYAICYGQNLNEGALLAITTASIRAMSPFNDLILFNDAAVFHIIYILARNNLRLDTNRLIKIQINTHKTLSERYTNSNTMLVTLIHNCFDLTD